MQTGDYKFVKNLNERLVLNLIRKYEIISSSDLVRITGMRPSTIFNILKDFSEKGFVNNLGKGNSTDKGGKKPYLWNLRSTAAYSIGIEVKKDGLTLSVLNFINEIILIKEKKSNVFAESKNLISLLTDLIKEGINDSEIPYEKFLGIGIAIPGIINSEKGIIILSEVISGENLEISEPLKETFKLPVLIQNNANTLAIGEKIAGNAKESKNLISLLIKSNENSNGIGMGILINEEIHLGTNFCAGEVNFSLPYFSEILNSIRSSLKTSDFLKDFVYKIDQLTIKILIEAALNGDDVAKSFFKKLGFFIGKSLVVPVTMLNPDTIVLAGDLIEVGDILKASIKNVLNLEITNSSKDDLEIVLCKSGNKSVAVGAAAIILNEYFRVPNLEDNKL